MKQIGLIPSGVQLWYKKVTCVTNGRLVYCSTIAVYIVNISHFTVERILTGHTQAITGITKSPHFPNLVATASLDQSIRIWEIDSGKESKILSTTGGTAGFRPLCLDWNPLSPFEIVCGGRNGTIRIYNYNTDKYEHIYAKSESDVIHIGYNPKNPNLLFAALKDAHICLIDVSKQVTYMRFRQTETVKLVNFAWDPLSSHYLLCAYENGELYLYDSGAKTHDKLVIRGFEKVSGGLSSISWIDNEPGNFISGDTRTGLLRFFNISQSTPIKVVKVRKVGILEVLYMSKGERVALSFRDGAVGIFNLKQKKMEFITPGSHTETIFDCAFQTTNPNIFATSSFDNSIKLWDVSKMKCIDTLSGDKSVIYSLAWHPDKNIIAGGFGNGAVWIWDVQKRYVLHKLTLHKGSCFKLAWNPLDTSLVAVSSKDMSVTVFKDDGKVLRVYSHPNVVFGVDWSPHDRYMLATGCHDFVVRIFNLSSTAGSPEKKFRGHTAEVFNVMFHPSFPNILISGSNDKTIRVWNTDTNDCQILIGHSNFVRALQCNPELPHIVVSGGWDGTIRVWDIRNNDCLHVANDHHADVYGLATHSKRPFIYGSTSRDTTVRFWSLEPLLKEMIIKAVMNKDISRCMGTPGIHIVGGELEETKLCGQGSIELQNRLKELKTDVEKYEAIFNFFLFPQDTQELWSVIASSCLGKYQEKAKVLHRANLTALLEAKAKDYESVKLKKLSGIGSARKNDRLKEAAMLYLKLGKIRAYCEIMVEIGQWEKALIVAPAVSVEYWRQLTVKYAQKLTSSDSSDCVPLYIASNETDKLLNFFLSRQQLEDATIIAQTSSEEGYAAISAALSAKEGLVRSKCTPPKVSSELRRITEIRANQYLSLSLPILAAACYAAIDDNDRAVRTLINGDEVLLAYAVSICLKTTTHNDDLLTSLASKCVKYGLPEYGAELLQQVRDKDTVFALVSKIANDKDSEVEKLYIKAGLQSPMFYFQEAGMLENIDMTKAIRYYALGMDYQKAGSLCVESMRKLFSKERWNWGEIKPLASAMYCIDATKLSEETMTELLAYASFIGGQQAIWKGYYSVAPGLIQNARSLVRKQGSNCSISIGYLDYMLCLAYSLFDQVQARNIIQQVIDSESLLNDSILLDALLSLNETISKSDNVYAQQMKTRRNLVIPTASNLPLRSINGMRTRSFITQREAQAPLLLLNDYDFADPRKPTDKLKYYVSLSEAIMWNSVNPFTPMNDGRRFNL